MKEFDFLKEKSHFANVHKQKRSITYTFKIIAKEFGTIQIWSEPGYEVNWSYYSMENDTIEMHFYKTPIENLKEQCPWFYEIIREACASLEKRDRIRNLFTKVE